MISFNVWFENRNESGKTYNYRTINYSAKYWVVPSKPSAICKIDKWCWYLCLCIMPNTRLKLPHTNTDWKTSQRNDNLNTWEKWLHTFSEASTNTWAHKTTKLGALRWKIDNFACHCMILLWIHTQTYYTCSGWQSSVDDFVVYW